MATRSFLSVLAYLSALGFFAFLGCMVAVFRPSSMMIEDLLED
jgi:hypothetical protein